MTHCHATIIAVFLLMLAACTQSPVDERLSRVAQNNDTSQHPLQLLMTIDPAELSEADRHYYDYLQLKYRKGSHPYNPDGSPRFWDPDSLIPTLLDWYRSRDKELYRDINYLAGEAYSYAGDLPTAMDYFHATLELLPDDSSTQPQRATLLSQMARLLNSMALPAQARDYLNRAIDINRELADTAALITNLTTLGATYNREHNYATAETIFKEACKLSAGGSDADIAKVRMYIAAAKAGRGDIDSAIIYIRNIPDRVFTALRPTALAHAADIYLKADMPDSAFLYASLLARYVAPLHRAEAYRLLLSPKLRRYSNPDSIEIYFTDYHKALESFYDDNEMQLAIARQLFYDYRLHDRKREEAENANTTLRLHIRLYILGALFVIVVLGLVVLYFKNRNQANIIELHEALENVKELRERLAGTQQPLQPQPTHAATTEDELRRKLRAELLEISANTSEVTPVPQAILQSDAYRQLGTLIDSGNHISSALLKDLEQVVTECSPKFRLHLNLLTEGRLTTADLHTALLIKCGIKPSQMAVLLGRTHGAIVSRRETLGIKILGKKTGVKTVDAIIRYI
ncbi:MAG: tetratricopeptide repeat protein [Bacteroides sp.]|nr:tetratricopeptide repeat protein [Bacteroides sp.]